MGERDLTTEVYCHDLTTESRCCLCGCRHKQNKAAIRLMDRAQVAGRQMVGDVCYRCVTLGPQGAAQLMVQRADQRAKGAVMIATENVEQLAETSCVLATPAFDPQWLADKIKVIPESQWATNEDLAWAELEKEVPDNLDAAHKKQWMAEHLQERVKQFRERMIEW